MTNDVTGVPVWQKYNLTLAEAAEYFNIGVNKLRAMSDQPDCNFCLFVGNKRLIKRKVLEDYLKDVSLVN